MLKSAIDARRAVAWLGLCVLAWTLQACSSNGPPEQGVREEPTQTEPRLVARDSVPECPHEFQPWLDIVGGGVLLGPPQQIPSVGPMTNVPEFHDCQRLRSLSGPGYDSLFAVFATPELRGMSVGMEGNDLVVLEDGPVLGAVVYSYGGAYQPLGIVPGYNCLYLDGKSAFMTKATGDNCPEDGGSLTGTRLTLLITDSRGQAPAVARWDWDDANSRQYIGLGCGGEWCEMGDSLGLTPSAPPNPGGSPVTVSKGWYDHQLLAVPDNSPIGLRPGMNQSATVIPNPDLGNRTLADYRETFVHTADIYLAADVGGLYRRKLGLIGGSQPNAVSICQGSWTECGVPEEEVEEGSLESGWWARIASATPLPPSYRPVTYRSHDIGFDVPGVTRFRWQAVDETIWVSCPFGCCEVEDY